MKKSVIKSVFAFAFAASLAGCGGSSYSSADIVDQTPQGSMEGNDWSMAQADVSVDSFDDTKLSVTLYGEAQDRACTAGLGTGPTIIFSIPRMEGEYPLSFSLGSSDSQTVTFVPSAGNNIIGTNGVVVVNSVSDTDVSIGLVADAGSSSVNGKFTATLCD